MRRGLGLAALLAGTLWSVPTFAQLQGTVIETNSRGRNTSVLERARPEYDSPGIYAGAFIISPEVGGEIGYTSNAQLTETDEDADGFAAITPAVRFNSTWSRHSLAGEVTGDFRRYFNNSIRDGDGYGTRLNGRYDLGADTAITANARAQRRYESQYSLTSVTSGAAIVPLNDFGGTLVGTTTLGRLRFSALGNVSRLTYSDVRALDGTRIDQSPRNRTGVATAVQTDYSIGESSFAFVQLGAEQFRYDSSLPGGLANRDSNALRILGGLSFDLTRLTRGRIGVGYIDRDYLAGSFRDVSGFTVEAQLEYFVTQLTTITFGAHRVIEDAGITNVGGFFRTGGDVRVDHELLRNLLLNAHVNYDRARYLRGSRVNLWEFGAGATYFLNRHITGVLDINYGDREQTGIVPGNGFDEFRAAFSLQYRL